jgi:DNA topoisomerase-1
VAKSVVIVESPAKARTIGKFLGKDYRVESCMGHVRDLPKKEFGIDIEGDFQPSYVVLRNRQEVITSLRAAVKGAPAVYLAPDPDREGEAIAWHLAEALKLPKSRVRRVTFNEITERGVRTGFASPRDIDMDLVNAQQARRILDRIVGYQLSPLLWKKVARGLSAGRVQSVALRLLVEREKEILNFKEREYWEIAARLQPLDAPEGAQVFEALLAEFNGEKVEIPIGDLANRLVERLRGEEYRVVAFETKRQAGTPNPPFATSQLQQAASVRLGLRPKVTMMLAQQLYEGIEVGAEGSVGLITYMRTDSFRVADEAVKECRGFIVKRFGDRYLSPEVRKYKSRRSAQGAHEAIRPTSVERTPEMLEPHLSADQLRLYRLIWERFVASQMADAQYDVTRVAVEAGPGLFRATGRVVLFDGHTRSYPALKREEGEEQRLPPLAVGQRLRCLELVPTQHFTKPPPRYTEASLVKTLEREGIGRPSTYAQIVSTIQDRGYVELRKKLFYAKELGIVTNDTLLPFFENVINTRFTSQLEGHLDGIEEGKVEWQAVLREFYEPFSADLAKAETDMTSVKKQLAVETGEACEKCGAPMVIRLSKRGRFLACSGFPKCRNTRALDEKGEPVAVEQVGEKCPECGEPLIVRLGRRGRFVGCSAYPKCRYTRPMERGAQAEKGTEGRAPSEAPGDAAGGAERQAPEPIGENCPKCGKPLLARTGSRGRFIGCSAYPRCRYTRNIEGETPAESGAAKSATVGSPTVATAGQAGRGTAAGAERQAPEPTGESCPECGKPLLARTGGRGTFIGCSGYPKCRYTRNAEGEAGAEATDAKCEKCGAPMIVRRSHRGRFLACSAYPSCKNTKPLKEAGPPPPAEKAGRDCPDCGKPLLVRHGPRGRFLGCSGYPGCRYTENLADETPSKEAPSP